MVSCATKLAQELQPAFQLNMSRLADSSRTVCSPGSSTFVVAIPKSAKGSRPLQYIPVSTHLAYEILFFLRRHKVWNIERVFRSWHMVFSEVREDRGRHNLPTKVIRKSRINYTGYISPSEWLKRGVSVCSSWCKVKPSGRDAPRAEGRVGPALAGRAGSVRWFLEFIRPLISLVLVPTTSTLHRGYVREGLALGCSRKYLKHEGNVH